MVLPNLLKKFRKLNFEFTKANPHTVIEDAANNIFTEVDITLENGDKVMIVEVKSKPTTEDVSEHIERMQKLRRYADARNDKRIYFGAVAGMVMNENVRDFILKNGFYAVEPSGKTFVIIPPETAQEF
jgi:molybdopterin converting factor small subunit